AVSARAAWLVALALFATGCPGRHGSARLRSRLAAVPTGAAEEDGADPGSPVVEDFGVPPAEEEDALASDDGKDGAAERPALFGDMDEIESRGVLRVLVHGGEEDYLPRAGMPAAFDRTLAREFAARHQLKLQFVLVDAFDQMIP